MHKKDLSISKLYYLVAVKALQTNEVIKLVVFDFVEAKGLIYRIHKPNNLKKIFRLPMEVVWNCGREFD